ncbi:hypothetical protein F4778DRAFT_732683 [Xylariomycetidae sp. FL2044]|nr:hypothetical protein F4778DRAFT_732683 [Xylariomycetidae sp. FL2044]
MPDSRAANSDEISRYLTLGTGAFSAKHPVDDGKKIPVNYGECDHFETKEALQKWQESRGPPRLPFLPSRDGFFGIEGLDPATVWNNKATNLSCPSLCSKSTLSDTFETRSLTSEPHPPMFYSSSNAGGQQDTQKLRQHPCARTPNLPLKPIPENDSLLANFAASNFHEQGEFSTPVKDIHGIKDLTAGDADSPGSPGHLEPEWVLVNPTVKTNNSTSGSAPRTEPTVFHPSAAYPPEKRHPIVERSACQGGNGRIGNYEIECKSTEESPSYCASVLSNGDSSDNEVFKGSRKGTQYKDFSWFSTWFQKLDLSRKSARSRAQANGNENRDADQGTSSSGAAPNEALPDKSANGKESLGARGQGGAHRGNQDEDEGDGGDDYPNRKRARIESHDTRTQLPNPRFACPYYKMEPRKNPYCGQPSKRNPEGGFQNFHRVREHILRDHSLSKRCQSCWKPLPKDASNHSMKCTGARARRLTVHWMRDEQEAQVRKKNFHSDDHHKWHELFCILFPSMNMHTMDCFYPHLDEAFNEFSSAVSLTPTLSSVEHSESSDSRVAPHPVSATAPANPSDQSSLLKKHTAADSELMLEDMFNFDDTSVDYSFVDGSEQPTTYIRNQMRGDTGSYDSTTWEPCIFPAAEATRADATNPEDPDTQPRGRIADILKHDEQQRQEITRLRDKLTACRNRDEERNRLVDKLALVHWEMTLRTEPTHPVHKHVQDLGGLITDFRSLD